MESNSEKVVVIVTLNTKIAALHARSSQTHQLVRPRDCKRPMFFIRQAETRSRSSYKQGQRQGKDRCHPMSWTPKLIDWNEGQMA